MLAVTDELKIVTSVVFELICIRDSFDFEDYTVRMIIDFIHRH